MKMADAKQKRNEQLKRWIGSETDLEPPVVKRKKTKVKFDDGAVFLAACSSGDTEEVLRLLERGADINYANVDGLTALHQVGAGPIQGPLAGLGRRGGEAGRVSPAPPQEEVEEEGAGGGGAPSAGGCRGGEVAAGAARTEPRGCGAGGLLPLPADRGAEGADGPLLRREGGAADPLSFFPLSFPLWEGRGRGPAPCVPRGRGRFPPAREGQAGERSGLARGALPLPDPGSGSPLPSSPRLRSS